MYTCSTEIDECSDETDNCHPKAICANTDGSFTCTCNPGFEGDGTSCQGNWLNYMSANWIATQLGLKRFRILETIFFTF